MDLIKQNKTLLIVMAIVLVFGLIMISFVNVLNTEARSKNGVAAQQKVVKTYEDKAWKIVKQKAQVSEKYAKDFKEIYPALMAGRYAGKDPLLSFVSESNPNFDPSLYQSLSNAIEAQREDLTSQERLLIDKDLQHDVPFDYLFSGAMLRLAGREKTEIVVVTSDTTEAVFNNGGVENSVDVFEE